LHAKKDKEIREGIICNLYWNVRQFKFNSHWSPILCSERRYFPDHVLQGRNLITSCTFCNCAELFCDPQFCYSTLQRLWRTESHYKSNW